MDFGFEPRRFRSSLGDVILWGRWDQQDPARPLALAIRGAFAKEWSLAGIEVEGHDVVLAHLPGMHSPFLAENSLPAFARAFDEVMAQLGRRPHVMGLSVGGFVAHAMETPVSRVAFDPPLQTAPLWPLIPSLELRAQEGGPIADWIWDVFGVGRGPVVNRDYRSLLRPEAAVVIAGEPLEVRRQVPPTPGLITEEDRQWLNASPYRVATIPDVGHNIPKEAPVIMLRAWRIIRQASRAAA